MNTRDIANYPSLAPLVQFRQETNSIVGKYDAKKYYRFVELDCFFWGNAGAFCGFILGGPILATIGSLSFGAVAWVDGTAENHGIETARKMQDILFQSFKLIGASLQEGDKDQLEQQFINHALDRKYLLDCSPDCFNINRNLFKDFDQFKMGLSSRIFAIFGIAMATIDDSKRALLATCYVLENVIDTCPDQEFVSQARYLYGLSNEKMGIRQPGTERNIYIVRALDQYVRIYSSATNDALRTQALSKYNTLSERYVHQL